MGYVRAYFLVALRVIFPKPYYVKVSYLPLHIDPISGKPVPVSPKEPKLKLPDFNSAVPSNWVSEEGWYYLVYAVNLSMLDPLTLFAPDSDLNDGVMYLVMIDNSFSRFVSSRKKEVKVLR